MCAVKSPRLKSVRRTRSCGSSEALCGPRSQPASPFSTVPAIKELSARSRNILTCCLIGLLMCTILSVATAAPSGSHPFHAANHTQHHSLVRRPRRGHRRGKGRRGMPTEHVVGSITEIEGIAQLQRAGHNLQAVLTMGVQMHDRVLTMPDAYLTITLRSGDQFRVDASSTIVIDSQTILLSQGLLKSVVASTEGYGVRTANAAVAAVKGTEFETIYIAGKSCPDFPPCPVYTDVGVHKGRVQVSNLTNPRGGPMQVGQGRETVVACERPPTDPRPLNMRDLGNSEYQ
jgi:hypothetical protein